MQYLALATDGDGTLLRAGHLGRGTLAALKRWRASDRKLLLVTGERPQELCDFPHLELFDSAVAENGALLVDCKNRRERRLAKPPPARLIAALQRAGIAPLKIGRAILETKRSHEAALRRILSPWSSDWVVVLNRKDLMIVPRGVTKASGLATALRELGIDRRQVVGVGDAENDIPMLEFCGLPVAVGNAIAQLKQRAALVTNGQYGQGVVEAIDHVLAIDALPENSRRPRHRS